MTEDEAKTKWCPFARVVGARNGAVLLEQSAYNRSYEIGPDDTLLWKSPCVASECMAWRWTHPGFDHDIVGNPIEPQPAEGYCGLAGKP